MPIWLREREFKMCRFIKKDKYYCWSNNQLNLVFSDGDFQANDEFMYVNSEKDILYFYYSVSIAKKAGNSYSDIAYVTTHDSPQVLSLINILHWLLEDIDKDVPLSEYQVVYYKDRKHYSYSVQTDDWFYDDFYKITRHVVEFDDGQKNVYYEVYFSASAEGLGSINTAGVTIGRVEEDELKELLKTAEFFVKDSIDNHNKRISERNQKDLDSYSIRHDKLYKMNGDCIEDIFELGAEDLEIICMDGTIKDKNYTSKCYAKCKINKINDDSIEISYDYVEDGPGNVKKMKHPVVIKIGTILDIFNNVVQPALSYDEKAIADDFIKILTEEELSEFINSENEDALYNRWCEAICNRTWMCRDEHQYFVPKLHKCGVDSVEGNIRYVMKLIKRKAKENH